MIRVENRLGTISISNHYFAELVGHAAGCCFGVKGLVAADPMQELRGMTGAAVTDRGVSVRAKDGQLLVDLHIEVAYGVNVSVVVKSIVSEVRFAVEQATGFTVHRVNVFVDAMSE